jgi:predicted TIM-barrel fold metal-dependent hydrolase
MRRSPAYHGLKLLLGLRSRDVSSGRADDIVADRLVRLAESADGVDQLVVLALDGVFHTGTTEMDRTLTSLYVPNDYVFEICARSPALLPGASVHPERPHAVEVLREVIDRGAVLIKWLPPAQLIDPSRRTYIPFYEMLAERSVPLLCHTSAERTFPTAAGTFEDPALLELPLQVGVRIIAAHCSAGLLGHRASHHTPKLISMMHRHEHLYADNAALCSPARGQHWDELLHSPMLLSRMVHGSDFPIPCWPVIYSKRLGPGAAWRLHRQAHGITRDVSIKRALGVPEAVFRRGATVLRLP